MVYGTYMVPYAGFFCYNRKNSLCRCRKLRIGCIDVEEGELLFGTPHAYTIKADKSVTGARFGHRFIIRGGCMIRVVIADDIQILRKGLEAILTRDPEICVVGLAANGKEAWELCKREAPDVVLMDMRMPGFDGAWGIKKIKEDLPETKALVLTTFDDQETVDGAVKSGADGYILKEMEDGKVIQSIKAVCAGIRVFGDSIFEGMRQRMAGLEREESADPKDRAVEALGLTGRERDIMRCVAQGMDNKEIAASLFLAEGTVRNNISRLLEKLKLKDRTQLAVFTVKHHLDG